ncbi:MAG: hypothetical protein WA082_04370 [Candidatus Moraniibacteriota bacterium]
METVKRPECFGQFSEKSDFCNKVCKHADDCIKKKNHDSHKGTTDSSGGGRGMSPKDSSQGVGVHESTDRASERSDPGRGDLSGRKKNRGEDQGNEQREWLEAGPTLEGAGNTDVLRKKNMICPNGHGMTWVEGAGRGEGYWDCFACKRERSIAVESPSNKMIDSRDIVTKDYGKQRGGENSRGEGA